MRELLLKPESLRGADDKVDNGDEDGEVAIRLARPLYQELAVLLVPRPRGEECAVSLEGVLVHRHGHAHHHREDCVAQRREELHVADRRRLGRRRYVRHLGNAIVLLISDSEMFKIGFTTLYFLSSLHFLSSPFNEYDNRVAD